MDFNLELINLQNSHDSMAQTVSRLDGQRTLLSQQLIDSEEKILSLEELKLNSIKAAELLHCVQRATRDKIQIAFENTVTFALRAIYKQDYQFKLEFGQRGNIGELTFKLKSPDTEGFLDLEDCVAGGSLDIISLALRFTLLQILRSPGMIVIDEGTKMLSKNYRAAEHDFYEAMSTKLGRQLILITHSSELIEMAANKIEIGG